MGFRLVRKSVTLNDPAWCMPLFCVISLNSVAIVANYVKVVGQPSTGFLPRNVTK